MYSYLYGLDYVIFRPSVPYGPRQNPRRRQGAVSVFLYQTLRNKPISIWGDGKIIRDFFYIDDLIRALVAAITLPIPSGETFNLAGSEGYSIIDLVKNIESALDRKIEINYEPPRRFDAPNLRLDTSHAKSKLNWVPNIDLNEGILRTADWLRTWIERQNE